jgi:hypothetical protein
MATMMNHKNGNLDFQRTRHFYGMLMDVTQFKKEQWYFMRKHALINRLVLGCGVVCGLNVVTDPQAEGRILIQPGVAIDVLGREIVVPGPVSIDPHQLTDAEGVPTGEPIDTSTETTVTICLSYAETCTDLVPVLVPDCDTPGKCAPSTIREGFRVVVRLAEGEASEPPRCNLGDFPVLPEGMLHTAVHALVCERINKSVCSVDAVSSSCVPLARATLSLTGDSIDECGDRQLVPGIAVLYEMILCLAERVAALAGGLFLEKFSGDQQNGAPNAKLTEPLRVRVLDTQGKRVANTGVEFKVVLGSGEVEPPSTKTDEEGLADTQWTLGPNEGEHQVTATADGTVFKVTFRAKAVSV